MTEQEMWKREAGELKETEEHYCKECGVELTEFEMEECEGFCNGCNIIEHAGIHEPFSN